MAGGDILKFFTMMDNQGSIITKDTPKLDLDLYISNYEGRTRYERLLHIGKTSTVLCVEALKAAVCEAKRGKDVQRYRDAWDYIRVAAPHEPEAQWDEVWVNEQTRANQLETGRLETELKGYKNNLVKESIRIGHRDLGEHLAAIGDLSGASDTYLKMRPDSSTQFHLLDVGKHIISILIQKHDWSSVLANVSKIANSSTGSDEEQKTLQPYQKIVSGLAYLGGEKYYEAARQFLDVGDLSVCQQYNDIISPNDVATYGGILALAYMNRQELQSRVLDSPTFRNYLELEPHIRKAVGMFVNGRYSACLAILESFRADYLLDVYLQKHIGDLYSCIRSKCIEQYFLPFSCVTLDSLNASFAKPGGSLDAELVNMIRNGVLEARINTIDKLLVAVSSNPRAAMQNHALETAKNYEREAMERIRRMSLAAADLEVKGTPRNRGGVPGAGGPGGSEGWMDDSRQAIEMGDEGAMMS